MIVNWLRVYAMAAAALALLLGAGQAQAGNVNVGMINVLPPTVINNAQVGGESIIASRNVNLAGTCLAGATVRWIQMATTTTAPGPNGLGFAGFSNNATFIDPIQNQPIGAGQMGNNTPFYDITVNNPNQFANPANWLRQGTGTFFGDGPQIPWATVIAKNALPWTVTFQTLVVATTAANPNTLLVLGGFQWGFTMSRNMGNNIVTLQQPMGLAFANLNANTWQTALNQDFGPAGTYTVARATCPRGDPVVGFQMVPEPSTVVLAVIGLPGFFLVTAHQRRRRTA